MSGQQSTFNTNQLAIHLHKSQTHTLYKEECSVLWLGRFLRHCLLWKSQDLDCITLYLIIQIYKNAQRLWGSQKLHSCNQNVWNFLRMLHHLSTHPEEINFVSRTQMMLLFLFSPSLFPWFHRGNLTCVPQCTSFPCRDHHSHFSHLQQFPGFQELAEDH